MQKYPKTRAVLVRRHGVYVWGDDWIQAKTHAECYDYLFEAAVRMKQLGYASAHTHIRTGAHFLTHGRARYNSLLLAACRGSTGAAL